MKINLKKIFLIFTFFISSTAFAADSTAEREYVVSSLYTFVTIFSSALGLVLIIIGFMKLKKRGDNPNDPTAFPASIIMTLVAGALMFNYSGSISVATNSLLGNEAGYCFVLDAENSYKDPKDNCWDSSNSEILSNIEEKINNMSSNDAGSKIKENAEVLFGIFQVIGLIFFIVGCYGLMKVSESNSKEGYGKPIITILASSLIFDLAHTIEMVKNTINYLGFGV